MNPERRRCRIPEVCAVSAGCARALVAKTAGVLHSRRRQWAPGLLDLRDRDRVAGVSGHLCAVRPEAEPQGDDHSRHHGANGALRGLAHLVEGIHGYLLTLYFNVIRVIAVFVSSD